MLETPKGPEAVTLAPELAAELLATIERGDYIVHRTRCEWCMAGSHDKGWHQWAGQEDIDYAAGAGHPDPSGTQCGCRCQYGVTKPAPPRKRLIHKGRKP
jgi:hypothetical protein